MKVIRSLRAGALLVVVLGLVAVPAPPVAATTVQTVTFAGLLTLDAGIGFMCTDPTKACPPPTNTTVKTDPKGLPVTNVTFPDGRNTRNWAFTTVACTMTGANLNKPGKQPADFGPCGIAAVGTLTGYCGSATGTGTGVLTDAGGQNIFFAIKFTLVTMTVKFTGTATKNGRLGNIDGTATAALATGNCANKTATGFTLAGTATVKIPTN